MNDVHSGSCIRTEKQKKAPRRLPRAAFAIHEDIRAGTRVRRRKRARFLALVALLLITPFVAGAQPVGRVYRIAVLETRSAALYTANIDAFREGMRELGYKEGQNL